MILTEINIRIWNIENGTFIRSVLRDRASEWEKNSCSCTNKKEKAKANTVPLGNDAILDVVLHTKGSIFLGVFLRKLKITFST